MYRVEAFEIENQAILTAHLAEHPFASLVINGDEGPCVEHLPLELDGSIGARGALLGHVSRANPVWRQGDALRALAVFVGPQAYVSPAWYATKATDPRVVPTWNYAAVHVSGTLRFFHDASRLHDLLTRLTDRFESMRSTPWHVSDAPADFIERMSTGIVGLELEIDRMQGKWKMSQNRPPADRAGVIEGLRHEARASRSVADVMAAFDGFSEE